MKLSVSPSVQLDTAGVANRAYGICQLETESNLPVCETNYTLKLARDLSYEGTFLNALERSFAACDAEQRSEAASDTRNHKGEGSSIFQSENRFEGLVQFERVFALKIEQLYVVKYSNWLEVFRGIDDIYKSADGIFGFDEEEFLSELYGRLSVLPFENCSLGEGTVWDCSQAFGSAQRELMSAYIEESNWDRKKRLRERHGALPYAASKSN